MAEIKVEVVNTSNVAYSKITSDIVNTNAEVVIGNKFDPATDYVEGHVYTLTGEYLQGFITPNSSTGEGKLYLDLDKDVEEFRILSTDFKIQYNVFRSEVTGTLRVLEVSPNRLEIKVESVQDASLDNLLRYTTGVYYENLKLNLGQNQTIAVLNVKQDSEGNFYFKLQNTLPANFGFLRSFTVVSEVTEPVTYQVNTLYTPDTYTPPTLSPANFDIEVNEEASRPTEYLSIEDLLNFPVDSTYNKLTSELGKNGVEISIDYSDFSNFVNYSSAKERLINFKYKLDLLYSYEAELTATGALTGATTSNTVTTTRLENLIKGILSKFDGYERFLYFENHEDAWPKTTTVAPFKPQESNTVDSVNWYNAKLEEAELYDELNTSSLFGTVPEYMRDDQANAPYALFLSMIGQHFDNIWIYAKGVSDKYNTDNRLNVGISKDLIGEVLKGLGVKLYTSNFSATNLASAFLGEWYDQGEEDINTFVTAVDTPTPDEDILAETYKRIYHNLPYLIKTKGTERGLRALINCFGIPDSSLRIRIFGGIETEETFPFFANQIGSGEKVRTDNSGTIPTGDTLSSLATIRQLDSKYTQDLHIVEVGFSTTYNVNDYIQANIDTTFDIDQYIGDPRDTNASRYRALDLISKEVLAGISNYDVVDFFRLIKFFDNQLFKMVRDFLPARDAVTSGLIVKSHALDRSKTPGVTPQAEQQNNLEGEIDTAFISGSEPGLIGSNSTTYTEVKHTPVGDLNILHNTQVEKINGELGGATIIATDQRLNEGNPFLKSRHPEILYSTTNYTNYNDFIAATPSNSNVYIYIEDLIPIFTFTGGGTLPEVISGEPLTQN